jgi:hypothetical protein
MKLSCNALADRRENKRCHMRKAQILAMVCLVLFPTIGFAQSAQTKGDPARTARWMPPPADFRPFGIVKQDLFDRNNPTNLRSDYHAPPAQPGQY